MISSITVAPSSRTIRSWPDSAVSSRSGSSSSGMSSSIATRGVRFFLEAALLYRYGEPIRDFIEKRLTLVTTVFAVGLVGGFVVLHYVF